MPRVANRVPELSEILCSSCGYVLDGLPVSGMCPECGKPIADSADDRRRPPRWEVAESPHRLSAFIGTTFEIIVRPAHFYRTLNVRGSVQVARQFAQRHWLIAGTLFGVTGATHGVWYSFFMISPFLNVWRSLNVGWLSIVLAIAAYSALDLLTRLAGRLTTWEATYRGLRLPYPIVLRGMYYHTAHYLPVSVAALCVVEGYQILQVCLGRLLPFNSPMIYLYVLCGLVVASAIYLFQTYWIGMRNMMYANR